MCLSLAGLTGAVLVGVRQGAAAAGLAVLFGCCALRQAAVSLAGAPPAWGSSAAALSELALLGIALGGLMALRSLGRTTRERDRAEDLHWDSMEAVRVISELAARPGMRLSEKLDTVLGLGCERFGLEIGIAWREAQGAGAEDGELIALRAPGEDPDARGALLASLLPRLRVASHALRPQLWIEREARLPVLVGTSLVVAGDAQGALAFAGSRDDANRFTATDKDVLGLMAQWLAVELERRSRGAELGPRRDVSDEPAPAEAIPERPPAAASRIPTLRALRPRRGRDLNLAVQRTERQLRRRLGADATLDVSLAPELPLAASGRLSLPTLVTSIVHAAARLAPTGRIHVETGRLPDAGSEREGDGGHLTLSVSVAGEAVDANALRRAFDGTDPAVSPHDEVLTLTHIERLLQRDGGDLSVSIEPRHRAVLTAFLPPRARRGTQPHATRHRPRDGARA